MQRFTDIIAWQRAHALALEIYRATQSFPSEEKFGLVSQLRRAAVSIAANIAEGSKRSGGGDYARMLNIAEASLAEVECLLILSRDIGYLADDQATGLLRLATEAAKPLHGLRERVAR